MNTYQAKDFFQLQTELVNNKVDMAVSIAIDRVIEQITGLKNEMHKEISTLRNEMHVEITGLRNDMHDLKKDITAVETTVKFIKDTQREISSKFIEYTFKAGWIMLASSVAYVILHFFGFIK